MTSSRVPFKQYEPSLPGAGTVLSRVNSGSSGVVVPAPPAGFFTVLLFLRVSNENTVTTMDWTVQDADGLIAAGQGTAVLAARGVATDPASASTQIVQFSSVPIYSKSQITFTVNSGGPGVVSASFCLMRDAGIVQVAMLPTASFQAMPAAIPSDAQHATMEMGVAGAYGVGPMAPAATGATAMNNDTASCNWVFRITRGAFVHTWTGLAGSNVPLRTRGTLVQQAFPALLLGDVFEVKLQAAPAVAGSIVLRMLFVQVPLLS